MSNPTCDCCERQVIRDCDDSCCFTICDCGKVWYCSNCGDPEMKCGCNYNFDHLKRDFSAMLRLLHPDAQAVPCDYYEEEMASAWSDLSEDFDGRVPGHKQAYEWLRENMKDKYPDIDEYDENVIFDPKVSRIETDDLEESVRKTTDHRGYMLYFRELRNYHKWRDERIKTIESLKEWCAETIQHPEFHINKESVRDVKRNFFKVIRLLDPEEQTAPCNFYKEEMADAWYDLSYDDDRDVPGHKQAYEWLRENMKDKYPDIDEYDENVIFDPQMSRIETDDLYTAVEEISFEPDYLWYFKPLRDYHKWRDERNVKRSFLLNHYIEWFVINLNENWE